MSEFHAERRRYTRASIALPVTVHQGGDSWQQTLVNLSLGGVATDQPDTWDAQYDQVFNLAIELTDGAVLELHAYLQHVEAGRLGFAVQHVDRENIDALRNLLESHLDDPLVLTEEVQRLD
ncbi:MAG: PilZ domain-containing protein [Gammaproteobacteria bacterium]|nr:MAG: PilZ domain-containing protein [Gammaproteobacteria bacterium]